MKLNQTDFWWKLEWSINSVLEESIIWRLESLGIFRFAFISSQDDQLNSTLKAWLPAFEWDQVDRDVLVQSLISLAEVFQLCLESPIWEKVESEDWSKTWKKFWKPDPVGNKLLILPEWLDVPEEFVGRKILKLDPGSAFGTGSHPSTRLCLELLQQMSLRDCMVADIGCGSGILGLSSLLLGARKVFAVDIDQLSVFASRQNASLNNLDQGDLVVSLGSHEVLERDLDGGMVDVIVCNILAPVIKLLIPEFSTFLSSKGDILLSGLLVSQVDEINLVLNEYGWEPIKINDHEKWALIHAKRKPSVNN